jgi:hypothetical protein
MADLNTRREPRDRPAGGTTKTMSGIVTRPATLRYPLAVYRRSFCGLLLESGKKLAPYMSPVTDIGRHRITRLSPREFDGPATATRWPQPVNANDLARRDYLASEVPMSCLARVR